MKEKLRISLLFYFRRSKKRWRTFVTFHIPREDLFALQEHEKICYFDFMFAPKNLAEVQEKLRGLKASIVQVFNNGKETRYK